MMTLFSSIPTPCLPSFNGWFILSAMLLQGAANPPLTCFHPTLPGFKKMYILWATPPHCFWTYHHIHVFKLHHQDTLESSLARCSFDMYDPNYRRELLIENVRAHTHTYTQPTNQPLRLYFQNLHWELSRETSSEVILFRLRNHPKMP